MKIKRIVLVASMACVSIANAANDSNYSTLVPAPADSPLYYSVGGGNIVPTTPSIHDSITIKINGLGALGYNCGMFNPNASIANAINGLEDTAMNMFNNVVNSAMGAVTEMPAYLIAKANPALYQLMQNGLMSGQWDFDMGLKSCNQMQNEIDAGKDPYSDMYQTAMNSKWKFMQYGSDSVSSVNQLSYTASAQSSVSTAAKKANEDNGKSGVQWTHGEMVDGARHAGGQGQPPILLTNDIVVAGVNAMLSRDDYYSNASVPTDEGLSVYFSTPYEAGKWAVQVLGEKQISTSASSQSASQPGKGLLPLVQKQYDQIFQGLVDLISGKTKPTVDNLKKVSTERMMINPEIIKSLQNDEPMRRTIETTSLAQGIAAMRVISKAQQLIIVLQAARQVPAISINTAAQEAITQYISTLEQQIKMIVNNQEDNQKVLVSTINTIDSMQAISIQKGNEYKSGLPADEPIVGGVRYKGN